MDSPSLLFALLVRTAGLLLNAPAAFSSQFYNGWAASNFTDAPADAGLQADPDHDGRVNLMEFALGSNPRVADSTNALTLSTATEAGNTSSYSVEIVERAGAPSGAQMDVYLSSDLRTWLQPWWSRTFAPLHPDDPPGTARELLTTEMAATNIWFARTEARLLDAGPEAARYYVATNGSDSYSGQSADQPFATLRKAVGLAQLTAGISGWRPMR